MVLEWTENSDGSKSTTVNDTKITIYETNGFWGYYLDDNKNSGDYGFINEVYAIEEAVEEVTE
jgi:hypothetical protein